MGAVVWNGLLVGGPEPHAPMRRVTRIPEADPRSVAGAGQRVQSDGLWRTTAYRAGLAGPLAGVMYSATPEESERLRLDLIAAASVNDSPLTVHTPLGPRTLFVARDTELETDRRNPCCFAWSTVVIASDPVWWWGDQTPDGRVDDSFARVVTTGLPSLTGGFVFPAASPYDWEQAGSTGDLTVMVDDAARISWRIDGPVTDPTVSVEHAGRVRTVAWRIVLSGSEYLIVDPHAQTSLLQGQSSRTPWLRQWPQLQRGENLVRFRADSYSAAALLTVVIRPTA